MAYENRYADYRWAEKKRGASPRFLRPGTIGGPAPQGPRERLAAEGKRVRAARPGETATGGGPHPEMLPAFRGTTPRTKAEGRAMTEAFAREAFAEASPAIRLHDAIARDADPIVRHAAAKVVRDVLSFVRGKTMEAHRTLENLLQYEPETPLRRRMVRQVERTVARLKQGDYHRAISEVGRVLERVTPAERRELIYFIERTGNPNVKGDTFQTLSKRLSTPAKAAARRVSRYLEQHRQAMAAYNWDPRYRLNYVTHMYRLKRGVTGTIEEREQQAFEKAYEFIRKLHALQGTAPPPIPEKGTAQYAKFQEFNPWQNRRHYDTYEKALLSAGLEPKYPDVLTLLRERQKIEIQNLGNVVLHQKLQDVKTADGLPILMARSQAPAGWREITHPAFRFRVARPLVDPESGQAIIENGKPKMEFVWETAAVHPSAWWSLAGLLSPPPGAHAATRFPAWGRHYLEAGNAIQKALRLSLSAFHPFALMESAAAGGRVPVVGDLADLVLALSGRKARIGIISAMREGVRRARDPKMARELAEAGLQMGPSSDAEIGHFDRFMAGVEKLAWSGSKLERGLGLSEAAGTAASGARLGKQLFDKALWDYMHTGLKAEAFYRHVDAEIRRAVKKNGGRELSEAELWRIKRETAKHVNAAFGGLNWEEFFSIRGERGQKVARWLMLAPDWTYSNLLIAADAFRGGTRGRLARKYWRNFALQAVPWTIAANYAFSGHFPWDNEIGHRFDIELPDRDEQGHKRYAKPFKQAREVARILAVGTDLWEPREYLLRKASPFVDAFIKQFIGDPEYAEEWQRLQAEGVGLLGQIPARLRSFAASNLPYTAQGGQQFAYAIPVAKGMTYYKARKSLLEAYLSMPQGEGRDEHVRQILTAAKENDPQQKWWVAANRNAKADVRQRYYARIAAALDKDDATPAEIKQWVEHIRGLKSRGEEWDDRDLWGAIAGRVSDATWADKDKIRRLLGWLPYPAFVIRKPPKPKDVNTLSKTGS